MLDNKIRHIGDLLRPLELSGWRAFERRLEPCWLRTDPRRRDSLASIPPFDVSEQTLDSRNVRMLRVDGGDYHGEDATPSRTHALTEGQTLHCDRLARIHSALFEWEARSERVLGVPPGAVMVKLSRSGIRAGFPWHFDPADVIVAQIRGRKRWWLGLTGNAWQPPQGASIVESSDRIRRLYGDYQIPTTTREVVLEPGDVLYVPRGVHHRTESVEPCESLSIRLRPPMWSEVMEAHGPGMHDALVAYSDWRRRSYGAWRFLWGDPCPPCYELARLLERDFSEEGHDAEQILRRWSKQFEVAERGGAVRRAV